uniref:Uncharacterized protein n=1 Tax=Moniliophthora roreri TaxID=221103 RepID=A0A0W0GEK8_MONRR
MPRRITISAKETNLSDFKVPSNLQATPYFRSSQLRSLSLYPSISFANLSLSPGTVFSGDIIQYPALQVDEFVRLEAEQNSATAIVTFVILRKCRLIGKRLRSWWLEMDKGV